jgi:hypothetical protein
VLAREHERLHDARAVDGLRDLVGVLLDDREQVGQQFALDLGEVGRDAALGIRMRRRPVDGRVGGDGHGAVRVGLGRAAGDPRLPVGVQPELTGGGAGGLAAYAATGIGALLRYRRPSSRRRW